MSAARSEWVGGLLSEREANPFDLWDVSETSGGRSSERQSHIQLHEGWRRDLQVFWFHKQMHQMHFETLKIFVKKKKRQCLQVRSRIWVISNANDSMVEKVNRTIWRTYFNYLQVCTQFLNKNTEKYEVWSGLQNVIRKSDRKVSSLEDFVHPFCKFSWRGHWNYMPCIWKTFKANHFSWTCSLLRFYFKLG